MRQNPEKLAWTVLIVAFAAFCVLIVSIPLAGYTLLANSEARLPVRAELTGGTVLIDRPQTSLPEALITTAVDLPENTRIETASGSQTLVTFSLPQSTDALASLQLFGETTAQLALFRTPQFNISDRNNRINIDLLRGRARLDMYELADRSKPTTITLSTAHAEIVLVQPGSYSVEVTENQTQVFVRNGEATVSSSAGSLLVEAGQRTTVMAGQAPSAAESGDRNLLQNGDFSSSLSAGWTIFKNRAIPEASDGEITVIDFRGRRALHFARFDDNWAELGVRQEINRDLRDLQSLRLQMTIWLVEQSLYTCGSLGSECPVMVRLEYTDITGVRRELLQGFYYRLPPPHLSDTVPTRCVTCPPPNNEHLRISRGVWFIYESPELLALIRQAGYQPARLNAITIYASGHRFESYVAEVALLAQD